MGSNYGSTFLCMGICLLSIVVGIVKKKDISLLSFTTIELEVAH